MFFEELGIYYEVHGEGKPLVLLNGIMMSTASWIEHIKILKNYFQVIVYDMRDQGKSSKLSIKYDISVHSEDLKKLLEHLGLKKVNLLGLSYGGQVAEIFASKYPEYVDKLILSNTTYKVDNFLASVGEAWKVAAKTYDGESFFDLALPFIYSKTFYNNNYNWLKNRRKIFKELLTKEWFDGFIRLASSNLNFDVSNEIEKIKCETLLIAADEDIITPISDMEFINKKIKKSEMVIIKNSGHAAFLEKINIYCNIVKGFLI
ncbi:alpha/beta hydrolase [Marinitoga sp. 38H-ov]|uniref:alpha/beta fold hydrolase n=1 Tax=Marinitoga sp. 38H-ov TaxID=1755814 RepID=UPI0013EBEC31|nr:alpha/beta hydrolase [Marinitoga sp. 38H-ov]KAF2955303.1 alpha/beta hydrolase [Marinitoga sp. 38H-ov]